jgi:hypothetical protein
MVMVKQLRRQKTKEEGNKRKKNRKHKKAKRNKQVLDPAEEEKIEESPYIKRK